MLLIIAAGEKQSTKTHMSEQMRGIPSTSMLVERWRMQSFSRLGRARVEMLLSASKPLIKERRSGRVRSTGNKRISTSQHPERDAYIEHLVHKNLQTFPTLSKAKVLVHPFCRPLSVIIYIISLRMPVNCFHARLVNSCYASF